MGLEQARNTAQVRLTAISEADFANLLPFFACPERFYLYLPELLHPYNLTQLRSFLQEWHDDQHYMAFALRDSHEELLGLVNLDSINWHNRDAEIGIALTKPNSSSKGYAGAALGLLIDYAFGELDLRRLYCRYIEGNQASARLFAKFGFRQEGCLRQAQRRGREWLDMNLLALLRSEYECERNSEEVGSC